MSQKRNSQLRVSHNHNQDGVISLSQQNFQLNHTLQSQVRTPANELKEHNQQQKNAKIDFSSRKGFSNTQSQPVSPGLRDEKESYQSYLNQNQSRVQSRKNQLRQVQATSILGGNVLNSTVNQQVSIEEIVKQQFEKKQNLNKSAVSQYTNNQAAMGTKISTGLGEFRTPTILAAQGQGLVRYSSTNQSPNSNQVKNNNQSQLNKQNNFEFGVMKNLSDQRLNESLDQIMEVQNLAQEYGLDNYSSVNKRATENSSGLGVAGGLSQHRGSSLLKNEILRNTHAKLANQTWVNNEAQDRQMNDLFTQKMFEQQQVKQTAISTAANNKRYPKAENALGKRGKSIALRKDGKNIGDLLQYKDYALDNATTTHKKNSSTKNQMIQMIMSDNDPNKSLIASQIQQSKVGSLNYSILSTRVKQEGTEQKIFRDDGKDQRILRNSYHPTQSEFDKQIRPRSLIKIPETLLQAFQNRNNESLTNAKIQPSGFHITDLLDYESKAKKKNELNSFYIQPGQQEQKQLQQDNEYVIKNYRLIQKKKREFFLPTTTQHSPARNHIIHSSTAPQSPRIEKPQNIRVSNSILSPNTYHFSTKISPSNQLPWNNVQNQDQQMLNQQNQILDIQTNEVNLMPSAKQQYEEDEDQNLAKHQFFITENDDDEDDIKKRTKRQPFGKNQLKKQPIKIIDTQEFDLEQRPNIVEENYKDIIASWVGQANQNKKFGKKLTKSIEDEQVQEPSNAALYNYLQKNYSTSKIFNQQSSDSIEVENQMILKLKPQHQMYKEQLLNTSTDHRNYNNTVDSPCLRGISISGLHQDDPYGHLKARNVFNDKAVEFQKQIELTLQNPDTRSKVRMIIELSKDFLTHLDKSTLSADRLPLELFDDFISENEVINKKIEERKRRGKSPLRANAYYFHLDGHKEEADSRVLSYDTEKKKFLIEFKSGDKILQKHAGRLNLHFVDFETYQQIEDRRNQARELRKEAQSKLNAERLFIFELSKKYDYIRLPQKFKRNIKKKLVIDLKKYDQEKVHSLVIQVEALFVFSILKSIIYSQIGDPFISRIVAQYKIEDDFEGNQTQQPYYALKSYEESGGKLEKMLNKDEARLILQDYAIVGKRSFIDAIQFLIQQNEEIVTKSPIFEFPVSQNMLMYVLNQEEFKGEQIEKMKSKLRQFPLQMHNFVKSQRILAKRFKETLEVRWTENIATKVEKIIDKEFDQNSREIQRKTLNPYVLKLFELIRLFQEKNLYDKLFQTLESYLKFLLQFAIRDSNFTSNQIFKDYEYSHFKVIMSYHPMIVVQIKIKKIKVAADTKTNEEKSSSAANKKQVIFNDEKQQAPVIKNVFEIHTKPPLKDVWQDFNGMIEMFINSVSRIRRIDEMVVPQLKLKKNTLRHPDKDKDQKLQHFMNMIQVLIDHMKIRPDKRIQKLQKYLDYLQFSYDSLILDMKRRSYEDQQSHSEDESIDANLKDKDDYQQENKILTEAYKNVEISEIVYIDKFHELREVYWDVLTSVENIYDFGMVAVDCSLFKQLVAKHIEKLLNSLSKYVTSEFLNKMNNLFVQFETIERKAVEHVETIDEVIHLIDYIDKIQKPDDLLDELENFLDVIKTRKDFIDTLQLRLLDSDFEKYLKLFSYPSRLRTMLNKRKQNLENERNRLSEQMNREKEKIITQINSFREELDYFKNIGLQKAPTTQVNYPDGMKEKSESNKNVIIQQKSNNTSGQTGTEISTNLHTPNQELLLPENKEPFSPSRTSLLSIRDSMMKRSKTIEPEGIFNPNIIMEMADKMEKLKFDLETTEQDCDIINRREKLLNMRITKFSTIQSLQNEIKPFIQMWTIAASYTRVYENWLYGNFYELNSDNIEEMINEWWKQLTRVSKTHISQYEEPMMLLNYILKELEKFKEYMPMITSLRSKGLEKRHWQMLSKQLGFDIDPNSLTLRKLIDRQLFEGPKLDIIKGISEIAIKEYAIKTTLDALEHELRIMEFQPIKYRETHTYIIKGLDDLITAFEESSIKIFALKSNSYAKHFMDKINRVEKELKIIVDVLDEWVKAQKSWVYLEPIFQQQDIAKQMISESLKFFSLDSYYKKEISNITIDPCVQRYCRKDGLMTQLQYVNKEFENITKGLSVYLEAKREYFARFYFLSNEEIIEILGQMREPRNVQRFLNKIFEGIDYLGFLPNGEIVGIYSKEDEYIQLRQPIQANESAENWLKTLEFEMRESIKYVIQQSVVDVRMKDFESWVKQWQGQAVVVVLNIILTETLTEIFNNEEPFRLKDILKQIVFEIESLTRMIRTKLDYNTRTTISSLLTNRVHARDTIIHMIESDVRYSTDFLWKLYMKYEYKIVDNRDQRVEKIMEENKKLKQEQNTENNSSQHHNQPLQSQNSMKSNKSVISAKSIKSNSSGKSNLSLKVRGQTTIKALDVVNNQSWSKIQTPLQQQLDDDKEQELSLIKNQEAYNLDVSMIDARRPYGNEYLGNTQRIVITPLTDRCYRSLFMALHFNYGGSPEGPVGTGKTETTKDLSKCLAKQCFVFNCSSTLNYVAMSKFFKGLATSGAWSCFDEFNRIDLSVLSVISQIIIIMQSAIRENKKELVLEDTTIQFNQDCAIFITMNPQYIGRTELPDNLKSLFRPVSMIVPDSVLISEILLYSFGFLQAKPLARKIVRAFNLAKQQLSNQIHYDFGLRSIKIVLQIAGLMKLKAAGVIEPDFKIKENKLKKKRETSFEDGENGTTPKKKISSLSPKNESPKKRKFTPKASKRVSMDPHFSKKMNMMKQKRSIDSSLDSLDALNNNRNHIMSCSSSEFEDEENLAFFKKSEIQRTGSSIYSDEEQDTKQKQNIKNIPIDQEYMKFRVQYQRNIKSSQIYSTQRKRFLRGNIDKIASKRLEYIGEHKDDAKQTRKLMKVLGIDEELIDDEEKIEEFIVLRAINDTNVPKLHQTDTIIFKGIIDDTFPQSIKASVKSGSLKTLIEEVIQNKRLQITEDITSRVLHLYESVMIRHGVMIVGTTLTGKTTSIQLLQDSLNKSRDNEIEEKIQQYQLKKARRLGLSNQESSFDENDGFQQNQIELTPDEIKMIKAQCSNKGVVTYTINPKSISLGQLMGTYDEVSHDWNDGIMANVMRTCSKDISERRKWIVFDGPIDPVWVENLNSVMDDNKKLTLSTGETIKMTGLMTIIIEAEDLSNCTPATISRCGMIFMKDEIIPLKGLLNKWIKSLPLFLEECSSEIDSLCNYFIPEILENFMNQSNLIYPVSQKWAIKNFCRYMDAMINDYRSDKFNSNNSAVYTIYSENQIEGDVNAQISAKISTIMGKRPYHVQYSDVDSRFQNATRNKNMWLQCFFLFSLVWSFGSILKISLRKEFDRQIRSKILCNTEEISTIAQLKSKMAKKQGFVSPNGGATGKNKDSFQPTPNFKEPEKPPYFLCPIPQTYSLFEVFFDLETNQWMPWESLKSAQKSYDDEDTGTAKNFKKKGSIFNKFIPTLETIRQGYIIEANVICKNNLLLMGPTGCGKSWISREIIFKQLPNVSQKYKCSTIVFSSNTTADKTQYFIDSRLERRRKGVFGPPFSHKYIFFIDDLMMPFKDEFGIQTANELLRQWFDFQGWYDHRSLDFKKIEDIQFLSCITVYESHKSSISARNEWHWAYLGTINMDERHYISLFSQLIDNFAINWPSVVQGQPINNLIRATLDLFAYFERHVKPTPSKFLYMFNTRLMFKIIYGIAEIEPGYLKSEFELAKLWIHESWRTLCDRISDYSDKKVLFGKFNEIARKYFKIGKNKLSKKIGFPYFCPFNKGLDGSYVEVEDMKSTTQHLRKYLSEYNEIHKKQRINVVLFDFLVEFMIKVHRIIKQPFSHGILIGIEGSGKHSLTQMACFLANYQLYEIKLEANYTQDDWYTDLKSMLQVAGVEQKEVVFHLKHNQIIKESFLEDLNTLVNNGEVQGIFTKEDYEGIISQMSIRMSGEKNINANNQIFLAEFSQKCRENLKVILNFTPTGANLRSRIRNYKSIVNCSTIVWMESWPQEGYKEVAETLLKEDEVAHRDIILEIAINIHMDTISMAKSYFYENQHYLYLTPHTFTDFIETYTELFEKKRSSLKELQERYETGLERLKNTQDQVEKFQQQLENNSPMLIEKQIEIEKLLEQLKEEHMKVGKRRDILQKEEEELKIQREQAERIKEECEFNLQKATPDLYAAISALQNLSKNEINELKTLKNAPRAVKLLMEGVCLLLKVEPIKFKAKDGVGFVKDYWAAATSKYVLGNPKLLETLITFDHTTLEPVRFFWFSSLYATKTQILSRLNLRIQIVNHFYEKFFRFIEINEWQPLKNSLRILNSYLKTLQEHQKQLKVISNSKQPNVWIVGLFLWIQALKNYYYIYQETQPKRDVLFYAEKQKGEKEKQIKIKFEELVILEKNLSMLKQEHQTKEQEIRVLQKQIDECSLKKERATKLLNGLGGEKQKWLVCNRMLAKKFLTIQGDVLLGAAFITYLSAFTQKYREQSVEKWEAMIKQFGIRISDDFNFNKIFGDQIKIKEWNFNGLPSDSFSISNAIVLEKSKKQCICIDPQYQANKWIKIQEKDIKILNFNDVNFIQSFEFAMKFGKKVLIENVGQKVDLILYPILRKDFVTEGGTKSVQLFGHMVEVDKNFRLFITSEIRNPHFGPDISVMTSFVNFYVTLEGLEEQMLSIVISNQKTELEEETIKMKKEALDYIRILKKIEDDILGSLHNDIEHILSDEHLIESLSFSKKTGRQIAENLQKVNKASTKILKSRGIYTPAAYRASLLYFLISDLSKIEVMYQFSLKWYIEIFTEEVKSKKHTDQDPLLDIIKNFTYTLYRKVCQSIFEKDKLLFTFLLAFRILEGENCLSMKLFEFFIKGPQIKGYDSTENTEREKQQQETSSSLEKDDNDGGNAQDQQMKMRKQKCPWITEHQWKSLEMLAKIPPFNRPNIVDHFLQNGDQWNLYIFSKDSDNIQMPGPYNEYDPEKEKREQKRTGAQKDAAKNPNLKEIREVDEEDENAKIDDKIWGLDEEEYDNQNQDKESQLTEEDENQEKFVDDREQIADSLVMGVSEYNEFRLGSVRFEKEMQTKKQQVLKDQLRFCIIRIFRPERVVREIQRFLGSVLDPRFMEPPVFNLSSLYNETSCYSPILFILSPTINTLNELQILKYQIQQENTKIEYLPLGSNINEKVQQLILKSAIQGNWLLLENLHLVTDWIPTLEKFIHTMYREDRRDQEKVESDSEIDTHRETDGGNGGVRGLDNNNANINMFPELKGCRISNKFRLWLSSMPVDYFPVSFLQECMKITLQPAQGIRQNALKILNSINYDFLQRCPKRQSDFRKLFFALCIFHSVLVERQRFGPIGWSQPYHFSENDFLISSSQLQSLMSKVTSKRKPLPLDLLRYLIGTLNYGGRVIKTQDEITLNALLETFMSERTAQEPTYRLTGLDQMRDTGIYYIPGDGDLQTYKVHIQKFPIQDRPEIFGLHENATIMRTTNEGKMLLERMFEFEFASKEMIKASAMLDANDDANLQKYSTIKKRIQVIIEDLPELLDEELCAQKYPISYESCINTLITKEVQRFNMLLQVIYVSLKNTLKALEGVIHINSVLEEIYKALTYEYVPKTWLKYCYPTFKSLSHFLINLKERVSFIRQWLSDKHPYNFWLPGFYDQQSFFTMLLQQKARQEKISIELLAIEYKVMKRNFGYKGMPNTRPADGCYVHGLWLEGAQWNDNEQRLYDCDSRNLYQELPCMYLRVIKQADFEQSYQNDNYYHCPLYLIALRDRLDGDFNQGLVTTIPLMIDSKSKPGFWIKRGTALLCQKEDN